MAEIVFVYKSLRGEEVDIAPYFGGLPPECFENAEAKELQAGGWMEVVGEPPNKDDPPRVEGLGTMYHAFPQTEMQHDTSWARNPFEIQYLMLMSDGDLGMLGGLGRALGAGKAFLDLALILRSINGCGFHKPRSMEINVNAKLNQLKGYRSRQCRKDHILLEKDSYQSLFGNLVDECLQTDCPVVGRAAWALVLLKCDVYELHGLRDHLERYHNPCTGRQGVWGRWNHIQQMAHALGFAEDNDTPTTVWDVTRGSASTANGIEGLMNKWLSMYTRVSLAYGPLTTHAQNCMTNLSYKLTEIEFSLVPDQQGECLYTAHSKKSGRPGVQETGMFPCLSTNGILLPSCIQP
jgi:hypothetical protein